jgi:SAM-dependent methyltransferase
MIVWPEGIVFHDVRKSLPFPNGSASAIYSSHMLEHLYFDEAKLVLADFRRLLSGEGVLRLALPDSEQLAAVFLHNINRDGAKATLDFNLGLAAHPMSRPSGLRRLSSRVGASLHRWQPTRALVTRMLSDAGFGSVTEHEYLSGDLVDLESVEHREESFFLEARVARSLASK